MASFDEAETVPTPDSRPSCVLCSTRMGLVLIQPDQPGFDLRTFECPRCNVSKEMVIQFRSEDEPKSAERQRLLAKLNRAWRLCRIERLKGVEPMAAKRR
jgi:hypothetical protein